MKKNWLIYVKVGTMEIVVNALRNIGARKFEALNSIGLIIVVADNLNMADLKKIDGILKVEEEKDIFI